MTIQSRARTLTGYDSGIISNSDMTTLEELTKDEIAIDTGRDDIDFTAGQGKSAAMWLLCLFCKIHTGEIGAEGYAVGELESRHLEGQHKVWFNNYRKREASLQADGGRYGSVRSIRRGREYGNEGDTAYGDN